MVLEVLILHEMRIELAMRDQVGCWAVGKVYEV